MIFRTRNSTYEVDEHKKCIRRLEGANDPTPNQGEDGVWQEYSSLVPLTSGNYLVLWEGGRATYTSTVLEVIE